MGLLILLITLAGAIPTIRLIRFSVNPGNLIAIDLYVAMLKCFSFYSLHITQNAVVPIECPMYKMPSPDPEVCVTRVFVT